MHGALSRHGRATERAVPPLTRDCRQSNRSGTLSVSETDELHSVARKRWRRPPSRTRSSPAPGRFPLAMTAEPPKGCSARSRRSAGKEHLGAGPVWLHRPEPVAGRASRFRGKAPRGDFTGGDGRHRYSPRPRPRGYPSRRSHAARTLAVPPEVLYSDPIFEQAMMRLAPGAGDLSAGRKLPDVGDERRHQGPWPEILPFHIDTPQPPPLRPTPMSPTPPGS